MPKKIKHVVQFLDKFEWNNALMGVIMVLSSLGMFFNYKLTMQELAITIGLLAIMKGFLNFNIFFLTESLFKESKFKHLFIFSAALNILIGLLLVFSLFASDTVLRLLAACWFILDPVPHIILLKHLKATYDTRYRRYLTCYILAMLAGVSLLITPLVFYIGSSPLAGLFLLASGGNLIAITLYE